MSKETNVQTNDAIEPKKVQTIELTKDQQVKFEKLTSVSAKIRYLASIGYSTDQNKYGLIARFMNKRIQHVRNVLTQPLKKA